MKKFIKKEWFKIIIIILLSVVAIGYASGQYIYYQKQQFQLQEMQEEQKVRLNSEKVEILKPWKPIKELYLMNEEINYGVASLKIEEFENKITHSKPFEYYDFKEKITKNIEESKLEEMTIIKLIIKNSFTNKNSIYISEQQFKIKDKENISYPLVFDDLFLKPSISGRNLYSGEEITGYLFFKKSNFKNPILEINLFKGSYPLRIELK